MDDPLFFGASFEKSKVEVILWVDAFRSPASSILSLTLPIFFLLQPPAPLLFVGLELNMKCT